MKRTFYIPLIGTPVYAMKDLGIDIPFTVQFLAGAYKCNDANWKINQGKNCDVVLKEELTDKQKKQLKQMDAIFGVPPCRFLSMLNVKHDNFATGDSQNCMMDIAKEAMKTQPKVFCFQNAPRLSSAKPALEWAIPQLMSILRPTGYKFAIYKTTTLNHGLPQKRQRTFFMAYKSEHKYLGVYKHKNAPNTIEDLIGDLFEQENGKSYCSEPQNELQAWFRKDNDVVTRMEPIENWFYWKELIKYCTDANKSLMYQIMYKGDKYNYKWEQMLKEVKDEKNHEKLVKIFEHANRKLGMGLGYWDASPMLRSGSHINAVISKNAYRLVHPNRKRLLTLRELSRFMGIPDRFKFHDKSKTASLHYITQNVPSFTFADVRWETKKIIQGGLENVKTDKEFIFIDNLSDPNVDKYYAYTVQEIKNCKALGKDKEFFVGETDNYQKSFIKKINN